MSRVRHPVIRVVATEGAPGSWTFKAYDDQGHLRSGMTAESDRAYVDRKIAEWYPGVPVEYVRRSSRDPVRRTKLPPIPRGARFIEVVRTRYPHKRTQARVHLEGPGSRRTLFEGPVRSPLMQALIRAAKRAPRVTVSARMVRDPRRLRPGDTRTTYRYVPGIGRVPFVKDMRGRRGLRRDPSSLGAEKARWDKLRAQYRAADEAASAQRIAMRVHYGDAYWQQWSSRADKSKLEKLNARRDKIGEKLMAMVLRLSPRGEAWNTGAPAHWIRGNLSWEDMIRPRGEPLSVVVPAPYGSTHGLTDPRRRRVVRRRR